MVSFFRIQYVLHTCRTQATAHATTYVRAQYTRTGSQAVVHTNTDIPFAQVCSKIEQTKRKKYDHLICKWIKSLNKVDKSA